MGQRILELNALSDVNHATHETVLRVSVLFGGCSGFQYDIKEDIWPRQQHQATLQNDGAEEQLTVFEKNGAKVVVDAASLPMLRGAKVDFVQRDLVRIRLLYLSLLMYMMYSFMRWPSTDSTRV